MTSAAELLEVARRRVLRLYGATLAEFRGPMPPGVLALYIAHESRGQRWRRTSYPEAGLLMLTLRAGDDETARFDVDPFSPRANVYGAQASFDWYAPRLEAALERRAPGAWELLDAADRAWFLWLPRSIGIGSVRRIIARALRRPTPPPLVAPRMRAWLASDSAPATGWGGQSLELVRLRVRRAAELLELAIVEQLAGGVPEQLAPLAPRPAALLPRPADLRSRLAWYARRAKRAGDAATGPWLE